jgi:hypothetical protein
VTKVQIVFTGKGGGRYLDTTRWLEEATRECYARKIADETLAVSWTLTWDATIARRGDRYVLTPLARRTASVVGTVTGSAVRDYCDEPEEGPEEVGEDWPTTRQCDGAMEVESRGSLAVRADGTRRVLFLRGPQFGSPPHLCELDVRNDQLVASVALEQETLARLSKGGSLSVPVGTRHPGPGVTHEATRICSAFPHRYDGILYLYDCEDTLAWDGKVTLSRTSG